jgi:DNA helicase-2/ATP-dependent DNA helicase PcrA
VSDVDLLTRLNPEQREAVLHDKGPLLVLAGAGSGKTRVITHRLARLVQTGVPARAIAAVTFTNKAAGEMRERAQALAGAALPAFVGTFHSWCLRFLRRRAREANLPPRFSIADSADQLALVKEALEELGISMDVLPANSVRSRISQAKNALISVQRFTATQTDFAGERIAQVYALYEKKLAATGALDFDDLIGRSVRLLTENAAVAADERRRIRHLLIDEYQDTNTSQDALVKLLGNEADSLCAVGDEDQSIYRWRGAEIEHILRFEEDFPGARVIALESNYRSTAKILAAASGVVSHNRRRREKRLKADRGDGAAVRLWHFDEDRVEVETVARDIEGSGRSPGEVAILYRTNAQSRPFEEEMVRRRIPYVVVGGMKFYERAEVKDVLAYLRLAARPEDDLAFRRVVNVPARGIGAATLDKLAAAVRATGKSWWEVSGDTQSLGVPDRARTALARFRDIVEELHGKVETSSPSELLEHLLAVTGYGSLYEGSEDREDVARRENIRELVSSAREFERRNAEDATIAEYLDTVSLATNEDALESGGAVTLSTLHAAKGLEFSQVFVVGLEEGFLPHGQSAEDEDELEEERRLLYVGMTRAKDSLTVTLSDRRLVYGRVEPRLPSRFLEEIPKGATEEKFFGRPAAAPSSFGRRSFVSETHPEDESQEVDDRPLRRGRRVRHPRYGYGVILGEEGSGEETRLTVYFDRAGKKKFVARYADLTPA